MKEIGIRLKNNINLNTYRNGGGLDVYFATIILRRAILATMCDSLCTVDGILFDSRVVLGELFRQSDVKDHSPIVRKNKDRLGFQLYLGRGKIYMSHLMMRVISFFIICLG